MNICVARGAVLLVLFSLAALAHAGDVPAVSGAWARATAPGLEVGAAYMVIEGGGRDDRLVGATSERAEMVQLHELVDEDGVAKMRSTESVEIAAGKRVELAPKGRHLMLMGLDAPLVAGQTFTIVLRFADSGEQTVTVTVRAATAEAPHPH